LTWAIIFSLAGYLFGKSAAFFVTDTRRYEHDLMLALVALITLFWLSHFVLIWYRKIPARRRLRRMRRAQKPVA
jgi:membrane protein DedA with SNARE-associated domain